MRLVAGQAILLLLALEMRGVAVRAIGDKLVFFAMTGAAVHGGVLAHMLLQLCDLLCVAGQAGLGQFVAKRDIQGGVGVAVAAVAVCKFVVVTAAMAFTAGRNNVHHLGRVPCVAVHAGDFGLVGATVSGDFLRGLVVALDAVVGCEFCGKGICRQDECAADQAAFEQPGPE